MAKKEHKILIIEDDPTQAMMYGVEFSNFGYSLLVAKNGREGIESAIREKPDLIILDILLGDMNGLDVLRAIKSNKETAKIKVVILSNYNKKGLAEECRQLGAVDFWIKSNLVPRDVVENVKKIIEK